MYQLLQIYKIFWPPEFEMKLGGKMYPLKNIDLLPAPSNGTLPLA